MILDLSNSNMINFYFGLMIVMKNKYSVFNKLNN